MYYDILTAYGPLRYHDFDAFLIVLSGMLEQDLYGIYGYRVSRR